MKAICSKKECTGCAACVQACPKSCIKMSMDRNGFFYPEIDATTCVNCGRCQRICPNNIAQNKYNADFYMGWHKDLNVLKRSSSGGAFTAIADYILDNGGVVYGASFDKTTRKVSHVAISSSTQLDEIRLSKYYQSSIGNAYKHVKEDLNNKMVLFSGTACQIAGLYAYLGSKPDNLLTVDVLCHGVTSIKVIDKYISCKEKKYKKKIINFKFRLKPDDSDWKSGGGTRMRLDFQDGTHSIEDKDRDTFFVGFNQYLFLRESCYCCKYTGTERIADFTLADYWGVPFSEISEKERRYGVSLILANSKNAKKLINVLKKDMFITPIVPDVAIAHNQALVKPGTKNKYRTKFFANLDKKSFDKLVQKYSMKYYLKLKVRSILKRLIGESKYTKIMRMIKGQ